MVVGAPTVGRMRTELPAERLHRRLGADPDIDSPAAEPELDEDQNSLLPRWPC